MPRGFGLVLVLVLVLTSLLSAAPALAQTEPPAGPRPAHIIEGTCRDRGPVSFSLVARSYGFTAETVGSQASRAVELGVTYVPVSLATLLAGQYAIDVHEHGQEDADPIACGGIESTGDAAPDALAIALFEEGGSGAIGIVYLVALLDGGTSVVLFLAEEEMSTAESTAAPTADTAAPTEEPTAAPATTETYVSPTYGYTLTYEPAQWRVVEGPTTEGGDDRIALRSGFAFVEVLGASGISDAQVCVQGLTDYFISLPTAVASEPLLDENGSPVAGGDANDAFAATRIDWTRDDGTFEETIHIRCIVLPPGNAALVFGLRTAAEFYPDAKRRLDELMAGLTLP